MPANINANVQSFDDVRRALERLKRPEGDFYEADKEMRTGGVWHDGKPIFRQVIHSTTLPSGTTGYALPEALASGAVETVVTLRGSITRTGSDAIPFPFSGASTYLYGTYDDGTPDIHLTTNGSWAASGYDYVDIIFEYTKA